MTLAAKAPAHNSPLGDFFQNIHLCRNKNELTHSAHPYPAKFIPHIPRILIDAYAPRRGIVLDPMCGSGTTLVEASVGDRQAIGTDLNPVAVLAATAKTTSVSDSHYEQLVRFGEEILAKGQEFARRPHALKRTIADAELPEFPNREKWFDAHVSRELLFIKMSIDALPSPILRTVALCAFSAIIVAVSHQESETRWCAKRSVVPNGEPCRKFQDRLHRNLNQLIDYRAKAQGNAQVLLANARQLPLSDNSIDVVVTSPPYANSHDYYLYNKLRLFWLNKDVAQVQTNEIGSRNRHSDRKEGIDVYIAEMTDVMSEAARVLKPTGRGAIVVADAIVRGEFFEMNTIFSAAAAKVGLEVEDSYSFPHKQFNSTFQRGFGSERSKSTHVLILKKRLHTTSPNRPKPIDPDA